jgi:phosphopantothenoylcysteine synthetase/decarboxylase
VLTTAYLVVCGASSATRAPELASGLLERFATVLAVPTPHAARVISGWDLVRVPGLCLVESYFDAAIRPSPPPGLVLVAPCTFNSLNKLALGIADNLALSIVAEAIGRQTPVIVALGLNQPLWAHPRARASATALRSWGCQVLEPVPEGDRLTLAPTTAILAAVDRALAAEPPGGAQSG